jgi:aminopeptidase YwaD
MALAINIDGVGYVKGQTAYSWYNCPDNVAGAGRACFAQHAGLKEGEPWPQSDHMVFVQRGRPALAFTSEMAAELTAVYAHSPKDTPEIVDAGKLVEIAQALNGFIERIA